jgi:hypothetical protein
MKTFKLFALVPVATLLFTSFASAQSVGVSASGTATLQPACASIISNNLWYGALDVYTNNNVTALQQFLNGQGYFRGPIIGRFGPLTLAAVRRYQQSQSIAATGYVGPLTRAAINKYSCGYPNPTNVKIYKVTPSYGPVGTTVTIDGFGFTSDNMIHFGYGVVPHVASSGGIGIACTTDPSCIGGIHQSLTFTVPDSLNPACRFTFPLCAIASRQTTPGNYDVSVENSNGTSNSATFTVGTQSSASPSINSITPASGAIGTTVTLYGSGFNKSDVILFDGGSIRGVSTAADGTQLSFTVPNGIGPYCPPQSMCAMYLRLLTPGTYQVSVKDESSGNTSNAVSFTLTGNTGSGISINGIDAPAQVSVGTAGTWTVHATLASNTSTTLHYSVTWGDEVYPLNGSSIMAPQSTTLQTSATFTHIYQRTGTFTPTFTVSNDAGQSATASASVTITPIY